HRLSFPTRRSSDLAPDCALIVAVSDGWYPQRHSAINRACLRWRVPWLRVYIECGRAIIGPCVIPWERGCSTCTERRRINAMEDAVAVTALQERYGARGIAAVPSG